MGSSGSLPVCKMASGVRFLTPHIGGVSPQINLGGYPPQRSPNWGKAGRAIQRESLPPILIDLALGVCEDNKSQR